MVSMSDFESEDQGSNPCISSKLNNMINKISLIGSSHNNNQDAVQINETDTHIEGIICDGCSTGIESEFISRMICYIAMDYRIVLCLKQPELLFASVSLLMNELKRPQEAGFATVILFHYDKRTKVLTTRFFGDGFVCINGEVFDQDQNNEPDYFIYHDKWDEYCEKYPTVTHNNVETFAIGTDGLFSFTQNQFTKTEDNPVEILTAPVKTKTDLLRRVNILTNRKFGHQDDLTIVSYANNE